mmetsp:Transcript_133809/g.198996  ORF Transcript_133809/g.198996 Transcript_133809/m.198996 type:complete len:125 (-) Transcript_133809:95-469(-)|eukprot:CAMPEP_0117038848 /NCGR_PEP_ID=MMETSP0472-20121206/27297_1 /TAXON_ID=693140 ORGANISM="Tiarina fusus, Strain LIS" /NCGR_SAMPLE_ID=MMETSP0472 /ASSEMBLY_ACC=CAM_ASM_000603 /LENGTH=124 /DNA_ID=CAMNT_0004749165 /DNA_START=204 /DNA_END=578 /DNA_ORIENTATION=-
MPGPNDQILQAISFVAGRLLQDDEDGEDGDETLAPSEEKSDDTPFYDYIDPNENENTAGRSFGMIVLAAIALVLFVAGWRSFQYWRIRREQYELQVQSARADSVLGDMQMVGNDEYDDDDPELL